MQKQQPNDLKTQHMFQIINDKKDIYNVNVKNRWISHALVNPAPKAILFIMYIFAFFSFIAVNFIYMSKWFLNKHYMCK